MPESAQLIRMAGASLNAKKILIVEDSYPIAESMSRTIADVGFATVGPVDTADRAIRAIEHDVPDGVLLDVGLREGSDQLKFTHWLCQVGSVPQFSRQRVVGMGAHDHKRHPASPQDVGDSYSETVRRTFDR
jgi:CheY-like chemotaxis protein